MAQFRKAMITIQGIELIQKTQLQDVKLEFSKIVVGSGEYAETEDLSARTVLKEPVQEIPISSFTVENSQTVKLSAVISNVDILQPYYIREIGVFALDPDKGEILYSLAAAFPGKADYLPAYDGIAPITIGLTTFSVVSNTENVTIRADTGAYASAADLEQLKEKVDGLADEVAEGFEEMTESDVTHIWGTSGGSGGDGDVTVVDSKRLVPSGGMKGQVLSKASDADFEIIWEDVDTNIGSSISDITEDDIAALFNLI